MSEIKPQLDAHSVGLIGVGMEKIGVDAFVEGGFFKGGEYFLSSLKAVKTQQRIPSTMPSKIGKDTKSAGSHFG